MSRPEKVAAKVWGGKPRDYKIIDEESIEDSYEAGAKTERLKNKKYMAASAKELLRRNKEIGRLKAQRLKDCFADMKRKEKELGIIWGQAVEQVKKNLIEKIESMKNEKENKLTGAESDYEDTLNCAELAALTEVQKTIKKYNYKKEKGF